VGEEFQRETEAQASEILHGRDAIVAREYTMQGGAVHAEPDGQRGDVETCVGEVQVEPGLGPAGGVDVRAGRRAVGMKRRGEENDFVAENRGAEFAIGGRIL